MVLSPEHQIQTSKQCKRSEPSKDCNRCPRLVSFRKKNKQKYPDYFNGAVGSFGDTDCRLLIIGLAPGLQGANKTGRPFTGDSSGILLFDTLIEHGYAVGLNAHNIKDGFRLKDTMITNAIRCVPPENKPTADEVKKCQPFLISRIESLPNLRVMMALGKVAHDTTIKTFGYKLKDYPFTHAGVHTLPNGLTLVDSYHCSRYNINTGRLTADMFNKVLHICKVLMD